MATITDLLRGFIARYIRTVGALEVLLLLHRRPDCAQTPDDIARELRGSVAAIAEYLNYFARAKILSEPEPGHYCYLRRNGPIDEAVDQLAAAYAERPVSIVDLIYAERNRSVRLLADAFKLKKD